MSASSTDLVAFVEARLTDDEQWALAASQPYRYADDGATVPPSGVHWTWVTGDNWDPVTVDPVVDEYVGESAGGAYVNLASVEQWPGRPWTMNDGSTLPNDRLMRATVAGSMEEVRTAPAGHIVRHDPARVLRDVEAKRAILAAVRKWLDPHPGQECDHDGNPYGECVLHAAATGRVSPEVLPLLAMAWSDHPDYLAEWRPVG